MMNSLSTAGLIVLKERKLLLAFSRNKKAWYLPGGKTDPGETTIAALIREISEELAIDLTSEDLHYYTHISAPAFGEKNNIMMEQDCFLCDPASPLRPSGEIEALQYFDRAAYKLEPYQVPGVAILMHQLRNDNRID